MAKLVPSDAAILNVFDLERAREIAYYIYTTEDQHFHEFVADGGDPMKHIYPMAMNLLRSIGGPDDQTFVIENEDRPGWYYSDNGGYVDFSVCDQYTKEQRFSRSLPDKGRWVVRWAAFADEKVRWA